MSEGPVSAGTLTVRIVSDAKGLGADVHRQVNEATRGAQASMRQAGGTLTSQARSIGSTSAHYLTVGAAAAGAGFLLAGGAAATMGIKTAASMEQAQVAFTTLLGSGQKAQDFLGTLSKFAANTPFTLPGIVDASRQLLGVGQSADSVIPTLTAFGDAAGALGLSQDQFNHIMLATTQAMANGKIQAGDMLQITQAGLPVWSELSKALGLPVSKVRELSQSGKLLTADTLPKLQAQLEKDYGGSMAKQSQTLTGLWSTFTDTLNIGLANVLKPMIPVLKVGLTGAINAVSGAAKMANDFVHGFTKGVDGVHDPQTKAAQAGAVLYGIWADKLAPAVHAIIPIFSQVAGVLRGTVLPILSELGTFLVRELGKALPIIAGLFTHDLLPAFSQVAGIVRQTVIPNLEAIVDLVVTKLLPVVANLAGHFIRAAVAIVGVFERDFMPIIRTVIDIVVTKLAPAIGKLLSAALDAARGAFVKIGKALHDHQAQIQTVLHVLGALIGFALKVAVPVIKVALKVAFTVLGTAISLVIRVIADIISVFQAMAKVAKVVWAVLRTIVTVQIKAIGAVITFTMRAIRATWSVVWGAVRAVAVAIWHAIYSVVSTQIKAVRTVISSVTRAVSAAWSAVWGTISGVASTIWHTIESVVSAGIHTVKGYVDQFVGFFTGLPAKFAHLFDGMFDGIKDAFRSAINFVISGWNSLQFSVPGFHHFGVNFGGFTIGTPDIPLLAKGGRTTSPGAVLVGDAGPEILELPTGATVTPLPPPGRRGHGRGDSSGAPTIIVQPAPGMDEVGLARIVGRELEWAAT